MAAAVERLFLARRKDEPLVIFGDYDVDGVTSTALLTEILTALGWRVNHYLPHRLDEGYGLSQDGVENCLRRFPIKLLLAVDCGSTAVPSVEWLRQRGVDVIVLDHHQVSNPPPLATALVNPRSGTGTFTELCSVGLAFKLAHALVKRGRETGLAGAQDFDLRPLLDLVALGTVADLVPLTGENRILVTTGLQRLQGTPRPGLIALKAVAEVKGPIGVYEVGFQLGPRLNAAGRLETAVEALNLLLAQNLTEAEPLARDLDARNRERQQIERSIAEEAIGAVRAKFDAQTDYVIVEGQLLWHVGVVGIVASRVLREFHRPTIIMGGEGEEWRGSGRSIEGFDLAAALRECQDLLVRHGGHAMAVAERFGATVVEQHEAGRGLGRFPVTANTGATAEGLRLALAAVEPGGVCTDTGIFREDVALPLGAMYTTGVTFVTSRVAARRDIPAVLALVAAGRFDPGVVTAESAGWADAPAAWSGHRAKLVLTR